MDRLDLQSHQQKQERLEFLEDWQRMQVQCPSFCERLAGLAIEWEEVGLRKLYEAKDENAVIHARAMVLAGRAMAHMFNTAESIQDELEAEEEELH